MNGIYDKRGDTGYVTHYDSDHIEVYAIPYQNGTYIRGTCSDSAVRVTGYHTAQWKVGSSTYSHTLDVYC